MIIDQFEVADGVHMAVIGARNGNVVVRKFVTADGPQDAVTVVLTPDEARSVVAAEPTEPGAALAIMGDEGKPVITSAPKDVRRYVEAVRDALEYMED